MRESLAEKLVQYDASGLADAILQHRLSVVDVIEAHFERIERLNKKYNALVTLDKERALQRAIEADRDLAQGKVWGALHGVPFTVKDALQTQGLRTTAGHEKLRDFIPQADAWVVKALKDAGAIVIGKSNCATLCGDIQTSNRIFGTTNNPWDVARTSGGSSGGEAVAVALGMSPLGIGSDTGGSIRIPSSYCGVFGFKPSIGAIPRNGLWPLHGASHARQDSLTVVGPIARSIRDLMLFYKVLGGEATAQKQAEQSPRIYWTHEFGAQAVDDEVTRILGEKFSQLAGAGADVVKVEAPIEFSELFPLYSRLHMFEFMPKESAPLLYHAFWILASLRTMFQGGIEAGYQRLKQRQSALAEKLQAFLHDCDCWVLPATPSVAFSHRKAGASIPMTANGRTREHGYWAASASLAYPFNLLGNPSVVIPVGKCKAGMPVAIQVVAKKGEDMKSLTAASYIAEKLGVANFSCGQFAGV